MKFMVYRLWRNTMQTSWASGYEENEVVPELVDETVVDESSDNLCIGGFGNDGRYYQFDSHKGYHAYKYFEDSNPASGLWIESFQVNIPDIEKYKVK